MLKKYESRQNKNEVICVIPNTQKERKKKLKEERGKKRNE
jgi:hypothetical protein